MIFILFYEILTGSSDHLISQFITMTTTTTLTSDSHFTLIELSRNFYDLDAVFEHKLLHFQVSCGFVSLWNESAQGGFKFFYLLELIAAKKIKMTSSPCWLLRN